MGLKRKDQKYYYDKFNELIDSGEPIINRTTKELFIPQDGEIFRQCYEDTPERKLFPPFWFVSREGNLLSVKDKKIELVHRIPREKGNRYSYKFSVPTGEKGERAIKNIELHNLVGLVFESEKYGLADDILKEQGIYGIGVKNSKEVKVNGHHIDGDDTNNDPSNIKFVSTVVHPMFDTVPKPNAPEKEQYKFMEKFRKIAEAEEPNKITILFPGHTLDPNTGEWIIDKSNDIVSTKKIIVTENFIRELQNIISFMFEDMGEFANE